MQVSNSELEQIKRMQAQSALTSATNSTSPLSLDSIKPADEKRWKTSLDFQTLFLTQMYKAMRETLDHAEMNTPSFGHEMFQDMFDKEIAGAPTHNSIESGPLGLLAAHQGKSTSLAAEVYRSLLRNEGIAQKIPSASDSQKLDTATMDPWIQQASIEYSIPSNLLRGVIRAESGGDSTAISPKGAKGLMQLMDSTAQDMGVQNPLDPRQNIFGGAKYLRGLLDRFGWDERKALAGYNAGPANVDRFGGVPPFPETQNYVERVIRFRDQLDAGGSR